MAKGINSARKMKRDWRKQKKKKNKRKPKFLLGTGQSSGIVIKLDELEAKQPNSGKRKIARIRLTKNGLDVSAFIPGNRAFEQVEEHDTVIIEGIGGSRGKSYGDLPGIRFKVVKVNKISLNELVKGRIQKPTIRR